MNFCYPAQIENFTVAILPVGEDDSELKMRVDFKRRS
jgi:hypothetical protein